MPKARIVTTSITSAGPLADQLRKRGYEVEIVTPNDAKTLAADLEFELESCPADQALDRAATLAQADRADVYVAAGCFSANNEPGPAVESPEIVSSMADQSEFFDNFQRDRDAMARDLREKRALMRQARLAQRQREVEIVPELTVAYEPHQTAELVDTAARALDPRLARRWAQPAPTPGMSPRSRELRVAFGVAAMIAAVFMLGWSVVSRGTQTPPKVTRGLQIVERQVPAGAAIINTPQLVQTVPAAPTPPSETRSARPKLPSTVRTRNLRSSESDDGLIAEDEVRYFTTRPKHRPPSTNPQRAGLKRLSDMQ